MYLGEAVVWLGWALFYGSLAVWAGLAIMYAAFAGIARWEELRLLERSAITAHTWRKWCAGCPTLRGAGAPGCPLPQRRHQSRPDGPGTSGARCRALGPLQVLLLPIGSREGSAVGSPQIARRGRFLAEARSSAAPGGSRLAVGSSIAGVVLPGLVLVLAAVGGCERDGSGPARSGRPVWQPSDHSS